MSAQSNEKQQHFIAANQLPQRWQDRDSFAIFASDFGDGSAFLNTWQLWQQDTQRSQRLHYLVFAKPSDVNSIRDADSSLQLLRDELLAQWPATSSGFHRLYLQRGQVMLTLIFGDKDKMLTEVTGPIDAFYLNDATDWTTSQCKQLWRLCKTDSTLVSHNTALAPQLDAAGFSSTLLTQNNASYLIAHCQRPPKTTIAKPKTQHAIILGAGMAGCAVAASLTSRNWKITLIDAQASIASQASGNHIGLCHPVFSLDDNFQARLSRAGFAVTQQKLNALLAAKQAVHFACDGHFQIAKDAATAQLMQAILAAQTHPNSLVQWLSSAECLRTLDINCEFGGYWFPQGMWANPASVCNGYINVGIENIRLQLNTHIKSIQYTDQLWHLYDADNHLVARSETLILANATDARRLLPCLESTLSASLRSVTKLASAQLNTTPHSISGLTYLTAEFAGWRCAGASLVNAADPASAEKNNLDDLAKLLGQNAISPSLHTETRLCFRPNSSDRLPLVGAIPNTSDIQHAVHQLFHIPRVTGLYGVLGFGSRGLTWHALAAEVLACQLNAEPQGIERSLLAAIDPARFALRLLRKKTSAPAH